MVILPKGKTVPMYGPWIRANADKESCFLAIFRQAVESSTSKMVGMNILDNFESQPKQNNHRSLKRPRPDFDRIVDAVLKIPKLIQEESLLGVRIASRIILEDHFQTQSMNLSTSNTNIVDSASRELCRTDKSELASGVEALPNFVQ